MNRGKIMVLILTSSMVIGSYGLLGSSSGSIDNILLSSSNKITSEQSNEGVIVSNEGTFELLNSPNGKLISYVSIGEMITYESGNINGYYKVKVHETGEYGYIAASNTQRIYNCEGSQLDSLNENGVIINVSTAVNIRKEAGINSSIIKTLSNGQAIQILDKQGQWYKVRVDGVTGFIYEEYISLNNSIKSNKSSVNNSSNTIVSSGNKDVSKTIVSNYYNNNINIENKIGNATNNSSTGTQANKVTLSNNEQSKTNVQANTGVTNKTVVSNSPKNATKQTEDESSNKVIENESSNTTNKTISKTETSSSSSTTNKTTESQSSETHNGTTNKITESNPTPVITVSNISIPQGSTWNNDMLKATTNNGATITYSGNVNTKVAGTYKIIVTATKDGVSITKTVVVTVSPVSQPDSKTTTSNPTPAPTKPVIKEALPTLTAKSVTVAQGSDWNNSQLGAVASEGATISYNGTVNTKVAGTYKVVITATNSQNETSSVTETVTVEGAPVISANDVTVNYGGTFNNNMLKATATEGATVSISGTVNTNKVGEYTMTITAKNSLGETSTKTVTVDVVANAPIINASNATMNIGGTFNKASLDITATDDGQPINYTVDSSAIKNDVPGTYNVVITATSNGKTVTKTVTVTVKDVAPTLTIGSNNLIIAQGSTWNNDLIKATATSALGQNLDSSIKYDGTINTNNAGTQSVVVSVTDAFGTTTTKTVTVTVEANPTITIGSDSLTVAQGSTWNNNMIKATANENATVTYSGDVNTSKVGTYDVTVTAKNSLGGTSTQVVKVTVNPSTKTTGSTSSSSTGSTSNNTGKTTTKSTSGTTPSSSPTSTSGSGTGSVPVYHTPQVSNSKTAPTVIAKKSITIGLNSTFSYKQLDAVTSQGARLTYTGAVNPLVAGTYKVVITATNDEGLSSSVTETVIVEGAPTVTASNVTIGQGKPFSDSMLKASASEGATITYSGNVNPNQEGSYNVKVTATNKFGASTSVNEIVTVVGAPYIDAQNISVAYGSKFSYSDLNATVNEGATIHYSGTVDTEKVGDYNITLTATNSYGNTSTRIIVVCVVANEPIINASDATMDIGTIFNPSSLDISATDNGEPIQYTVDSSAINNDVPGTYNVTITATANGKTATKTVQVIVKDVNPTLTIPETTISVAQGSTWNNDLIKASATSALGQNIDSSIKYTGDINTNEVGDQTIEVTATDRYGVSRSQMVTVHVIANPTLAVPSSNMLIKEGSTWNNDMIKATSNENATITYSGTVNTSEAGTYDVTVTATNSVGGTSTQVVKVTVEGAPVITANNMSVNYGDKFTYLQLKATATQGAILTYSGNVNTDAVGTYDVTITATNSLGETSTKTVVVTVTANAPVVNNKVEAVKPATKDVHTTELVANVKTAKTTTTVKKETTNKVKNK